MYYNIFQRFKLTKMNFTVTASRNSFNYVKLFQGKVSQPMERCGYNTTKFPGADLFSKYTR